MAETTHDRLEREASFWDATHGSDSRDGAKRFYKIASTRRALFDQLCLERGGYRDCTVMELGAYTGGVAFDLARTGASVIGIDISKETCDLANAAAHEAGLSRNLWFLQDDAEAITEQYFPGTFDLICGKAIIHHLDLGRAIPEIRKALKPDGEAVFMEPMVGAPWVQRYRDRTPSMRTVDEHPLTDEDLILMAQHFQVVDVWYFHLFDLAAALLVGKPGFRLAHRALEALDVQLFQRSRLAQKLAWYAVIRCRGPRQDA